MQQKRKLKDVERKGHFESMNSIGKECNELKAKYDECFQVWFSEKFLKGDTNEDMCKPIFGVYKECVRVSQIRK